MRQHQPTHPSSPRKPQLTRTQGLTRVIAADAIASCPPSVAQAIWSRVGAGFAYRVRTPRAAVGWLSAPTTEWNVSSRLARPPAHHAMYCPPWAARAEPRLRPDT